MGFNFGGIRELFDLSIQDVAAAPSTCQPPDGACQAGAAYDCVELLDVYGGGTGIWEWRLADPAATC